MDRQVPKFSTHPAFPASGPNAKAFYKKEGSRGATKQNGACHAAYPIGVGPPDLGLDVDHVTVSFQRSGKIRAFDAGPNP